MLPVKSCLTEADFDTALSDRAGEAFITFRNIHQPRHGSFESAFYIKVSIDFDYHSFGKSYIASTPASGCHLAHRGLFGN
jgi:hypothetical protein